MADARSFTSRSYRSVYDPNAAGGPRLTEFESASRGVLASGRGGEDVTETKRWYTDSGTGYERMGLARTVRRVACLRRRRFIALRSKALTLLAIARTE